MCSFNKYDLIFICCVTKKSFMFFRHDLHTVSPNLTNTSDEMSNKESKLEIDVILGRKNFWVSITL
jgi:hypothetical protein